MTESTYAQPAGQAPAGASPAPVPQPQLHPADVIAADGTKITLADGRVVELRYTIGSLRLLEARFGSLAGMQRAIDVASNGRPCAAHRVGESPQPDPECDSCTQQGSIFTVLADAIAPGLLHERVVHPDTGQHVRLGKDAELCAEQLDPGQIGPYMTAWASAFQQAVASLGNGAAAVSAATPTSPYRGQSGTTQPQSPSGDLMPLSGA